MVDCHGAMRLAMTLLFDCVCLLDTRKGFVGGLDYSLINKQR